TARFPGRTSASITHVSFVKPLGTTKYVYSMVPFAGTLYAFGISITTSGLMFHPSRHSIGGGMSFGSPSGAPASTHAASVLTSVSVSLRSFAKCPNRGSANHGGIFLVNTASLMDFAHGRALS